MLSIRLSRVGKTKRPSFRILVADKRRDPWGKHLEILGHVDPLAKPKKVTLEVERIKYWLSKGAQPTPTVRNLLIDEKVIEGKKVKAHPTHQAEAAEEKK